MRRKAGFVVNTVNYSAGSFDAMLIFRSGQALSATLAPSVGLANHNCRKSTTPNIANYRPPQANINQHSGLSMDLGGDDAPNRHATHRGRLGG
jgi:hypothetical protein